MILIVLAFSKSRKVFNYDISDSYTCLNMFACVGISDFCNSNILEIWII